MASGRLGALDITSTANLTLYTCPANTFTVLTVSIVNRAATSINVRIAIAAASTPLDSEWIEYDSELLAKGVLERTGIVLEAGKLLVVRVSGTTGVSAVAYGIETSTS